MVNTVLDTAGLWNLKTVVVLVAQGAGQAAEEVENPQLGLEF